MRCAPLTSMEKTVSKWTLHRTSRLSEPQWELESEWDPGLLQAYIARLFLTTRPSLITEFPPGPLRKHVWLGFLLTRGQIQTESKNDSIDSLQPPPPRWKKKRRGWGGQKCFRQGWHAPWMWHSKSWLQSCSNFTKPQTGFLKKKKRQHEYEANPPHPSTPTHLLRKHKETVSSVN